MDVRGNLIYGESKQNPNRKSRLSYLGKALTILLIVALGIISILLGYYRNELIVILFIGLSFLLLQGVIYLWNFLTIGHAKVYEKGIVLPETTITGKEKFVRFDEINRIAVKTISQKKYLILEKKGAEESGDVDKKDILCSIFEDDIYNLETLINSIEGKVEIFHTY